MRLRSIAIKFEWADLVLIWFYVCLVLPSLGLSCTLQLIPLCWIAKAHIAKLHHVFFWFRELTNSFKRPSHYISQNSILPTSIIQITDVLVNCPHWSSRAWTIVRLETSLGEPTPTMATNENLTARFMLRMSQNCLESAKVCSFSLFRVYGGGVHEWS